MTMRVEGVDKVVATLRRIDKVVDKAALEVIERATNEIAEKAKDRAPVRTGKLRRNIVAVRLGEFTFAATVRRDAFYGLFIEFGTKPRKRGGTVRARPFLTPAYEEVRDRVLKDMRHEILIGIRNVA